MPKRILVVHDDELMRSFLSSVLREEGYGVEEARNGAEGLSERPGAAFVLATPPPPGAGDHTEGGGRAEGGVRSCGPGRGGGCPRHPAPDPGGRVKCRKGSWS